jgi:hypothetical protein
MDWVFQEKTIGNWFLYQTFIYGKNIFINIFEYYKSIK